MRLRRAFAAAAGGAAAAIVLVMIVAAAAGIVPEPSAPSAHPTSTPTAAPLYAGGLQDPARGAEITPTAAVPTQLRIPAIGVDTGLEQLAVGADGRLAAPVDYDLAGWFSGGVVPGEVGPALIAGHVDSLTDAAVFYRIADLQPGDRIEVDRSDGTTVVFVVTRTAQSPKAAFPTSEVYSAVPQPELRLITCAGAFDPTIGHYTDNLIVFATLAP